MKHIFFVLALLLVVPFTASIGVSPSQAEITFAPYYEGSFDVMLRNSRANQVQVEVDIGGTLGEYFTATNPSIGPRSSAISTVSFALPEDIPPGRNKVTIRFSESFFDPNEGLFSSRTAVIFDAYVWKPYPGQFAEVSVTPTHVPAGQNTHAEVVIRSRGDQTVRGDVQVRVYTVDNRLIDSEVIPAVVIESDRTWRRFVMINSQDFAPGRYSVRVRYDFGASVAEQEATLIIGIRDIDLLDVTRDYYLDRPVNPFTVRVESLWNEPIESVEASVQLGSSTGRSPTIHLAPFTKKGIEGFWTTDSSLAPGEYNALVTVLFRDGEPVVRSFPVTVHALSPQPPQIEEPARVISLGIIDLVFLFVVVILIGYVVMHVYGHGKHTQP